MTNSSSRAAGCSVLPLSHAEHGTVTVVVGFLASNHAVITETRHNDDLRTHTSFTRTVFIDSRQRMPAIEELDRNGGRTYEATLGIMARREQAGSQRRG
jgi:formyltetrahydrofolate hydrolase